MADSGARASLAQFLKVIIVSRTPLKRPSPGHFPTTHWSQVITAGDPDAPRAREALAALCNAYWYPLYAFIRRQGHTPEQAQDLTQDLFAYVLQRDLLAKADPGRGRFRSFLRGVCVHYLSDQRDRENAHKRGGGRPVVSIDALVGEERFAREPSHELTPERCFDRVWALTLLSRVFDQLQRDYEEADRAATFKELSIVLTRGPDSDSYATIAARLGTTEGAIRVAVHRLRRHYGLLLRREIAATVDDPAEIAAEIRDLFAALETDDGIARRHR